MPLSPLTPNLLLKNLEELYSLALTKENLPVALKILELLGRQHGLFAPQNTKKSLELETLTENDLKRLIKQLESKLKLDQQRPPRVNNS